jgi:DNA polymerase III subunit epsilon
MGMKKDLREFDWWGGKNPPPENFKTKKQLSELGLSSVTARGVIHTLKYDVLLFDVKDSESVKPKRALTQKQLKALEIRKEKQRFLRFLEENYDSYKIRIRCGQKAYELLLSEFVVLSSNTTDLSTERSNPARFTNICIINNRREVMFEEYINPEKEIDKDAYLVDGIAQEKVNQCQPFPAFYEKIKSILSGKTILVWSAFHLRLLNLNCYFYGLPKLELKFFDIQKEYYYWYYNYNDYYYNVGLNSKELSSHGKCLTTLERLGEISNDFNLDLFDMYEIKSSLVIRENLEQWFKEKYPEEKLPLLPKNEDVMLGNFHTDKKPREGDLMLSPNCNFKPLINVKES